MREPCVMILRLPVIDVSPLLAGNDSARRAVAEEIGAACRDLGFFYAAGHAISPATLDQLARVSHRFFALPEAEKMQIAMARGGRAWRGFFPVGGELTSGKPDIKEGIYFGEELGPDDARVAAGLPLHGANLFTEPYLLTNGGGPNGASTSPVLLIYQKGIEQQNPDVAAAIGVVLIVFVLAIAALGFISVGVRPPQAELGLMMTGSGGAAGGGAAGSTRS
jgi:hypothetical protein